MIWEFHNHKYTAEQDGIRFEVWCAELGNWYWMATYLPESHGSIVRRGYANDRAARHAAEQWFAERNKVSE